MTDVSFLGLLIFSCAYILNLAVILCPHTGPKLLLGVLINTCLCTMYIVLYFDLTGFSPDI
jgi:hypothetical protein